MLKALAYETLNACYPEEEWLRVYTDGSRLDDSINAGAGVHCELFSLYTPIGPYATAFDGEVAAIHRALLQLQSRHELFSRVVFLSDSKAALHTN